MKGKLIAALKVIVPLAIGAWLVMHFHGELDAEQQQQLYTAIRQADPFWLVVITLVGWLSHALRAWRWDVLLEPLGHRTPFLHRYHAVMAGYFMNLFIPRAGEATRAVSLDRTDGVPFQQGFGSIMAERVVDMVALLLIAATTMVLQWEMLPLLEERIAAFRATQDPAAPAGFPWLKLIAAVVLLAAIVGFFRLRRSATLQGKLRTLLGGFVDGLRTVFSARRKGAFVLGTIGIWGSYVGMFVLGFHCLPGMEALPLAGKLAAFVAGSIGIILVQGGIGVYPAFVGMIITVYLGAAPEGGMVRPDALAFGWLLWLVQTLMLIVLGGISLLWLTFARKRTWNP